jgi:hypothetical protein
MTILGDQMRIGPASHTMGIGAASVWTVSRLWDGRIAVGSFGQGLMTAEEVADAINQFQAMLPDGAGRDTVGS